MSIIEFPERVALDMASYIDASPSPYHACDTSAARLVEAGFTEIKEIEAWTDVPERGFVRRGGSLFAWFYPADMDPATGFRIAGAHTDSPNLRIKPRPDTGAAGFRQLGVEVYGGVLLNSWLDRDLGLSGRAFVSEGAQLVERHFRVDRPILRVPQLAIHLDRTIGEKGLKLDKQQHMSPVMAVGDSKEGAFAEFLGQELGVPAGAIKSYDAMVHDLTPSGLLGSDNDMLAAPRLDNLCSSYCALTALVEASSKGPSHALAVTLFDHEEVGSASRGGADGPLLGDVTERLILARGGDRDAYLRSIQDSICVSADMAHAVHPSL